MRSSLEAALAHVLAHEGGWANDPRDPGGCTMRGITLATYRAHGHPQATCASLRRLSVEEARRIYTATYWSAVDGDVLPPGVDLLTFDHGVNAGPARALALLRRALGVRPGRAVRVAAVASYAADPRALVRRVAAEREAYYRGLTAFRTFGRGWLRRVQAAELAALDLVAADLRAAEERRT